MLAAGIGAGALLATSAAAEPETTRTARRGQAPHLIVLGDSLSDPKVAGGGYLQPVLKACSGARIDNHAKGGFMLNQIRRRFEQKVLPSLPASASHLLVFGGVNDLYSDETALRTLDKIERDLSAIFREARARKLRLIVFEVAPWGGFSRYYTPKRGEATRRLNHWLHQQLAQGVVDAVIPTYELLSCGDPEQLCPEYQPPFKDGLHFGTLGHKKLGEALLRQAFAHCLE